MMNIDNPINADGTENMFALTILKKNQRNKNKVSSRKCKSIIMRNYQEMRVKVTFI